MSDKREAVQFLVGGGLSVQRACALLQLQRSTFHYVAHPTDDTPLVVAATLTDELDGSIRDLWDPGQSVNPR